MPVLEWLRPFDVVSVVCIALSLAATVLACTRGGRKKREGPTTPSTPSTKPVSSSDATSKQSISSNPSSGPITKEEKKEKKEKHKKPAQKIARRRKDSEKEDEKGERVKHSNEGAKARDQEKEKDKGSIRISIHCGAPVDTSDATVDDMIYMQEVFDDVTARDDPLPGENMEHKPKKARRKKAGVALQATQNDSDYMEPTQHTTDQSPTVDTASSIMNDHCTQTGYTIDNTRDSSYDPTQDTNHASDGPATRPKQKRKPLRRADSKLKTGDLQRNKKNMFKYDPSETGRTDTESTKMGIPMNRQKGSVCVQKSHHSIVHKDMPTARS